MKIIRFMDGHTATFGLVEGDTVYRTEGDTFHQLTRTSHVANYADVTLLIPILPSKIIGIGQNYGLHVTESDPNRQAPADPLIFMKPPSTLLPHNGVIKLPPGERIDYEAELCVVIGREAYRISQRNALSYVLGYTCGNDVSHRDYQRKDGQRIRAKGFDTFCPLGPVIDTELDPSDLVIRSRVNGDLRQDSRTSNLLFDVPYLISFISDVMTLMPGDVIMTGTPEGVGPLRPGDTVEVEIEGVGVLRNTCQARS